MALPKRDSSTIDSVPQEVQDYYRSERRERTGVAWLLALGTLVVTVLLAVGLFFGGKWLFQKITGDKDSGTTTSQTENTGTSSTTTTTPSDSGSSTNASSGGSSSGGGSGSGTTQQEQNQAGSGSAPAANTTPPATSSGSQASTPASTETLTNTGPGDTLAVFLVATAAGTLLYRMVWLRRN